MNFQDGDAGSGCSVASSAILAAAFSSLPSRGGVTVNICGSQWLDIGLFFSSS